MPQFLYSTVKADGRLTIAKQIVASSKDEAMDELMKIVTVGTNILLFDTNKEYKEAKSKANEAFLEKKQKENEVDASEFADFVKPIFNYICEEVGDVKTKTEAKNYGLYEKVEKPYYIYSYQYGSFCTKEDIIREIESEFNSSSRKDDYIYILDVKTLDELDFEILDIKLYRKYGR